uniref:sialate O-acetylesterase n=1 Tax=Roseateles sp. TaxID=1971397 RepID=UPI003BA5349C
MKTKTICSLVPFVLMTSQAYADVRLPRLVSDGLVLQRSQPLILWGWADDGEAVTVSLGKQELKTHAQGGRWQVQFDPLAAGGPYQIEVQGKNKLQVKDVLIGDVWLASGQSNMQLSMDRVSLRYPGLIASTQLPTIREFNVPQIHGFKGPQQDFPQGAWKKAVPAQLGGFSAAGFFFARSLQQQYQVPIGLISIAVGGSPAEAWMSEAALQKYPHYLAKAQLFKDDSYVATLTEKETQAGKAWNEKILAADLGLKQDWASGAETESDWQAFRVPGYVKEQGSDFSYGAIWFRRSLMLNPEQAVKPATLWLGAIADEDRAFVNGREIGKTDNVYLPRIYAVPAGVLKAGQNTLSVRVVSKGGKAGFIRDKRYALDFGDEELSLFGAWQYKVGANSSAPPMATTLHYQPGTLFNAKLAPVLKQAIKGVIWYQGESNTGRASEYTTLFPDLIRDWRSQFQRPELPFLYVQLASYQVAKPDPSESIWAATREAQRQTLGVSNTAMAVAIDIGDWNDIHPLNKQAVGERLALAARKMAYGETSLVATSPNAIGVERQGKTLLVSCAGLISPDTSIGGIHLD